MKAFPARLFTYSLFKNEIVPFFVNRTKKEPDKIQMIFTSILRQALVVMIAHTPIRSVRTFFLWKLTAMTDLQMGHLILIMPSTASGSASNNLLFLQHGQATCTSCISFRLPQEASQKGMSNWPLVIFFIFLCTVCRDLNPMVAINIVYRTCVLLSIIFALPRNPDKVLILLKFTSGVYDSQ